MERSEAEAVYDAGREAVVEVLLRMDRRIQELEARVEKLEHQLRRSSRNSSLPPSSDPPGAAPRRSQQDRSGKRAGGQPGHEGHGRELLPASAVDEVIEHWPLNCECGRVFAEADLIASREPARHQVEELPQLAVRVIEHRCERLRCPQCGVERTAELPGDVAASAFGPRLQAAIATLSVRNRVSRRDLVELCEELFGARICAGTIDAILARTGQALESPYEELLDRVRSAPALNVDETGWRLRGAQRTLWGAFTQRVAVFSIEPDRHEQRLRELLGSHHGVVTSDRWWAYDHLPLERRQVCWSHLQRDFQAHAEGLGAEREFGEHGLRISERVFWAWEVYQHTHCRRELRLTVRALRRAQADSASVCSWAALQAHPRHGPQPAQGLAGAVDLRRAQWCRADQQPCRARTARRCHLSQALARQPVRGRRATHRRLLSASITCRLQRRSLFFYLSDLLAAHARGDPAISLA